MAMIRVTAAELRAKAGELRDKNQNLRSQVKELEAQENALAGKWEGEAKNAFHNAFTNDKGQWDTFSQLVDTYVTALENIATEYEKAEMNNVNTANTRSY